MPTVYITAPPPAADELARDLVDHRLAACVNCVDCQSTYRWEDDIVEDTEIFLLAKTTETSYLAPVERVPERHSYEVSCIERFDEDDIHAAFGAWITDATARDTEKCGASAIDGAVDSSDREGESSGG